MARRADQLRHEAGEALHAAADLQAGHVAGLDGATARQLSERLSHLGNDLLAQAERLDAKAAKRTK